TLKTYDPHLVFNLVESLDGKDQLIHLFPSLLDVMNIPYTGSSATALFMTSNKILAKRQMVSMGLNTPIFFSHAMTSPEGQGTESTACAKGVKWLFKSAWDHASVGLDEDELLENKTLPDIQALVRKKAFETGKEWFAEQYVDGREFNVSLLAGQNGPVVLPPAEILFSNFPENKPKIVGYRAKWEPDSFEYQNTTRTYDFPEKDHTLLENLKKAALACWSGFDLQGYARVDFRVDPTGCPYILEINSNPCLSPDAGFAAALSRAGIDFTKGIQAVVAPVETRRAIPSTPNLPTPNAYFEKSVDPAPSAEIEFRYEVEPEDIQSVAHMTRETGFFREDEIRIAVELVEERLAKGPESGYFFVFALVDQRLAGYTCFGPVPCTLTSYDLYWIAVYPEFQNRGIGKQLLEETERLIKNSGGLRVYIETSHKDQYESTRSFYTRCGYTLKSLLEDFYSPGDAKATYCKVLL
ncbi:MAG: GNAT family N-acetyltransferase, partial [Desulfobacteraceae bacterium]|nr:GNAT family N-acetyltransferase [Desulfobacteraceae bacterium]